MQGTLEFSEGTSSTPFSMRLAPSLRVLLDRETFFVLNSSAFLLDFLHDKQLY